VRVADGEGCPRWALPTRDGVHEDPKIHSMASPTAPLGSTSPSARCVAAGGGAYGRSSAVARRRSTQVAERIRTEWREGNGQKDS
jgi:hypothetical protein